MVSTPNRELVLGKKPVPAGLDLTPFTQWVPSAAEAARAEKKASHDDALCAKLVATCPANQCILDILAELSWFELGHVKRVHQEKDKKLAIEHSKLAAEIAKMSVPLTLASGAALLPTLTPRVAEDLTDLLTQDTVMGATPSPVPLLQAEKLEEITQWGGRRMPGDGHLEDPDNEILCPVGQCWRVWKYRLDHPNNHNIHAQQSRHDYCLDCGTGFEFKSMWKVPDTTKGVRLNPDTYYYSD